MQPNPLEKQPSGIPGLDNVLKGGFPKGRISVLRGGHGTGKTVIALNFLYTNALEGVPGLFVSFEEDVASIRRNAASMGWDLEKLEAENKLALVSFDVGTDMILSGDFDISATIAIIQKNAESVDGQLCVIDAFDWLLSLFSSKDEREEADKTSTQISCTKLRVLVKQALCLMQEAAQKHTLRLTSEFVKNLPEAIQTDHGTPEI